MQYNSPTDNFLVNSVKVYDRVPSPMRTPTKDTSLLHASALVDFCPRRASILLTEKRVPVNYVLGSHKIVWELGRAAESHVRNALFHSLGKAKFYGVWECKCGESSIEGIWSEELDNCALCNTKLDNYKEASFKHKVLPIIGNPDLLYVDSNGVTNVVEIKSINITEYKAMIDESSEGKKASGPKDQHVKQASKYVYILQSLGIPVNTNVSIFYVCKDFMFKHPYAVYTVDVAEKNYTSTYDEEVSRVSEYLDFLTTGVMPKNKICSSVLSKYAKSCPAATTCFKGGECT